MALAKKYPEDFERLWAAYPKWPPGRSKKEPSYKAFAKVKKELGFTAGDIAAIEQDIERRKRDCLHWQHGSKFGPEMFATYMNQHRWNEPYERVQRRAYDVASERRAEPEQPVRRATPEQVAAALAEAKKGLMH